jgi:hypothetical protein
MALLCVLALFALTASAQDKVSPEKAYLKALVGEWDADVEFGGGKSKGSQSSRMLGDLWMLADFKSDFGGQAFSGHSVSGYDQNKKKFVGIWVDTMESGIMHTEGTLDSSGKVLTEIGEGMSMGQKTKHKMVTELKDKDTIVFKMYMTETDKEPMMTITYKRKK